MTREYTNPIDAIVNWNGHTSQTNLDVSNGGPKNQFTSKIAETAFGADTTFNGQQFHFHAGSEHTVDGVRHDLEMHTVHYPTETKEGFIAAALGIMFSVENFNVKTTWAEQRIIDTFFDTLKWEDETTDGPTVDLVTYGNMMEMADFDNRWIYKGSVTTPPCATAVYWNVLSSVYPLKAEHLALFKEQLNRGEGGELDARGNWREIQEYNDQELTYVYRNKATGLFAWPMQRLIDVLQWIQDIFTLGQ